MLWSKNIFMKFRTLWFFNTVFPVPGGWITSLQHVAEIDPVLAYCWAIMTPRWPGNVPALEVTLSVPVDVFASPADTPSANTKHRPSAGLMLVHRRRRWPNIKPALVLLVLPGTTSPGHIVFWQHSPLMTFPDTGPVVSVFTRGLAKWIQWIQI